MTDLPNPPVPPECDCTDLDGFMLNVERLMASELVALSSHEVVGAAVFLWCRAWKQRPAASLPDDERVLAAYARMPVARFRKLRSAVMHGFVKCSDGRLYHVVLAAEAMRSFNWKLAARSRREADAERLKKWRESQKATPDETTKATKTKRVSNGKDRTGQDIESDSEPIGSGADAPIDPAAIVFGAGLKWLQERTKKPADACRALLGKWRKSLGDEALIAAIGRAQREGAIDPVGWMEGAIRTHAARASPPRGGGFNL